MRTSHLQIFFAISTLTFIGSCRVHHSDSTPNVYSAALVSEHPEVVKLMIGSKDQCTATAITPRYFLTAAHCGVSSKGEAFAVKDMKVLVGNVEHPVEAIFYNDQFSFKKSNTAAETNDLAIGRMATDVFKHYAQFGKRAPTAGELVKYVGYGFTGIYHPVLHEYITHKDIAVPAELQSEFDALKDSMPRHHSAAQKARAEFIKFYINKEPRGSREEFWNAFREVEDAFKAARSNKEKHGGFNIIRNVSSPIPGTISSFSKIPADNLNLELYLAARMFLETDKNKINLKNNTIISLGDSGGPTYDSEDYLVGVIAQVSDYLGDDQTVYLTNMSIDLFTDASKDFFARAKAAGFDVGFEPTSSGNASQENNAVNTDDRLFARLADPKDTSSLQVIEVAVASHVEKVWMCKSGSQVSCMGTARVATDLTFKEKLPNGRKVFVTQREDLEAIKEKGVILVRKANDGRMTAITIRPKRVN